MASSRWVPVAVLIAAVSACSPAAAGHPHLRQVPLADVGLPCSVTSRGDSVYVTTALTRRVGPPERSLVRRIDVRTGRLTSVLGSTSAGHTADGWPAGEASLGPSCGIALDQAGNILVSDSALNEHGQIFGYNRVRVLAAAGGVGYGRSMTNGHVYTIAGGLHSGYSGDDGRAVDALLRVPSGLAVDPYGNVAVADSYNNRIRVVAERSGTFFGQQMQPGDIYTVAGNGIYGYSGDGGPGSRAAVATSEVDTGAPETPIVTDRSGNILFGTAFRGDGRVRLVAESTGTFYGVPMRAGYVYTIAGGGSRYSLGDELGEGQLSVGSGLGVVTGLAVDGAGNIVVTTIYQVWVAAERTGQYYGQTMTAGHFYHLAGQPANVQTPVTNGMGDGVPESQASFDTLSGVSVDSDGNVVLADLTRVRVIAARSGTYYGMHMIRGDVYTIAGVFKRL